MFIKELKIINFKSFNGAINPIVFNVPDGQLGSGLNIFVGENNTGKSTAFEAIDFVRNSTKKEECAIKNKNNPAHATVELTFVGDIEQTIDGFSQPNKVAVFKRYIYQNALGENQFKINRSTEDIKQVKLWNETDQQYLNESGIDAPIRKLFETNFIWADTNPNDEAAFGATTICGNLLREIANSFTETDDYADYKSKFNQIFNDPASGLRRELLVIEQKVQQVFTDQFGAATISFHFDELKIDSFFKNTTINVNDGIETPMQEKGNGMQRAVALALLQVYAEELTKHPDDANLKKPFFLFIDEPEICLHPKGQEKLLNALLEISKTKQVFITTHSPYFLSTPYLKNCGLHIFSKNGNDSVIESATVNPLLPWSPTWGEINFKAYKLPTVDFHNELYGYLQEKNSVFSENTFEQWIVGRGTAQNKQWTQETRGVAQAPRNVSLQTFIRNKIHHPENVTMNTTEYTSAELTQSIHEMINLL
jgi:predicted ATP-binding protein involved in virulence